MFNRDWRIEPDYERDNICKDCNEKENDKTNAAEFCKEVIEQLFGIKNSNEDLLNNALFELAAFFDLDDHMTICDRKKFVFKKA